MSFSQFTMKQISIIQTFFKEPVKAALEDQSNQKVRAFQYPQLQRSSPSAMREESTPSHSIANVMAFLNHTGWCQFQTSLWFLISPRPFARAHIPTRLRNDRLRTSSVSHSTGDRQMSFSTIGKLVIWRGDRGKGVQGCSIASSRQADTLMVGNNVPADSPTPKGILRHPWRPLLSPTVSTSQALASNDPSIAVYPKLPPSPSFSCRCYRPLHAEQKH